MGGGVGWGGVGAKFEGTGIFAGYVPITSRTSVQRLKEKPKKKRKKERKKRKKEKKKKKKKKKKEKEKKKGEAFLCGL